MVGWLELGGRSVGWLGGWSVGWVRGWFVGQSVGWVVGGWYKRNNATGLKATNIINGYKLIDGCKKYLSL